MIERKAVYYGQVELIPGIVCDGYVLNDDTAVMSKRRVRPTHHSFLVPKL